MDRLHEDRADAREVCTAHIRKDLVSDKKRVCRIGSQFLHGLTVTCRLRLSGFINILHMHRIVKHLYPWFLIVGQEHAFESKLL